jgi:glycosyltransferase involved in cell wall biosynthesis
MTNKLEIYMKKNDPNNRKQSYVALGNQAFRNKKFKEALAYYEMAVLELPEIEKIITYNLSIVKQNLGIHASENSASSVISSDALSISEGNVCSTENEFTFDLLCESDKYLYNEIKNIYIDWRKYFSANNHDFVSEDPIIDYILTWKKSRPLIPGYLDTDYYLEVYPDILECGLNPLWHYAFHGHKEGRIGLFNEENVVDGDLCFDSEKETIVFVSHESSATGAPLLGCNIANELNKYNIVHIIIRKSNIHDAFLNSCFLMLHSIEQTVYVDSLVFMRKLSRVNQIKCVVINSIVAYQVMHAANTLGFPVLFLIHEFSEYMRPLGTMLNVVLLSDVVVVPEAIIQNSIQKELIKSINHKHIPINMHIIPQGKLPYIPEFFGDDDTTDILYKKLKIDPADDVKIIVGSGWVQIRKGIDLFIATARYIKKIYQGNCKFVWVGDGFDPTNDLAYSVYLQREIEYSGLGEDLLFLEHQKKLDAIFSISDVFCLSSRMDPFPNVVIDALSHDLHIACFKNASGSADFLLNHNANCTVVDFVDTYALAEGIVEYLCSEQRYEGVNKEIVEKYLDFSNYVDVLDNLITQAVEFKKKSNFIVDYLMDSGEYSPEYVDDGYNTVQKCRRYVENGMKGIHLYNPKSGFSESAWLCKNSKNNPFVVPLFEALRKGQKSTHAVFYTPRSSNGSIGFVYAVHLHLYYIELADIFVSYFKNLPGVFDLFITIVDSELEQSVREAFQDCGARNVGIVKVDNIGRDMGAFLFGLRDVLYSGQYEVIGHFHSKKSTHLDLYNGNGWLKYLLENLIGDSEVARSVVGFFNNPEIGLVYPEDSNFVDIGENSHYIAELCNMLNLPVISQISLFPVGNMFWARFSAIKQLFMLDQSKVLQEEPLPNDGSYMHALERITPYLTMQSGYKAHLIYKRGTHWK